MPLLSDWNGEATRAFDVAHEFRGFHEVSARSAFVLDGDGVVRFARLYETGEVPDFDDAFSAASALTDAAGRA